MNNDSLKNILANTYVQQVYLLDGKSVKLFELQNIKYVIFLQLKYVHAVFFFCFLDASLNGKCTQ